MVIPPQTFNGSPIEQEPKPIRNYYLPTGGRVTVPVEFELGTTAIEGVVQSPLGRTHEQDLQLEVFGPGFLVPVQVKAGKFSAQVPTGAPLEDPACPGPGAKAGRYSAADVCPGGRCLATSRPHHRGAGVPARRHWAGG
jgi:hypothetical protein